LTRSDIAVSVREDDRIVYERVVACWPYIHADRILVQDQEGSAMSRIWGHVGARWSS